MQAVRWLPLIVALVPASALAQPGGSEAASQSVALLPLDAGKSLELYGQPVASELARALASGNIDVQIVGPKMAVPAAARLIVDGTVNCCAMLGRATLTTVTSSIAMTKPMARVTRGSRPVTAGRGTGSAGTGGRGAVEQAASNATQRPPIRHFRIMARIMRDTRRRRAG